MHARHATQTTPWGAAGGGWQQRHVAPHGSNALSHAIAQSMRGGTNLGRIPVMQGSLTSRLHPVFRRQMAKQGRAAQKKRYAEVMAAGGSRAHARRQSLLARREARRHFSGGRGKGTWHRMTGGDGRRRVRLHKPGGGTRRAHSIYRTHQYSRPTKRGKPYGKKAGEKMFPRKMPRNVSTSGAVSTLGQGWLQGGTPQNQTSVQAQNQTGMQSRIDRTLRRQRSMDRYNQRRAGWGMAPVRRLGWGMRGGQQRAAPFGRDERRYGNLERNAALRTRLGLPSPRLTYEEAGWYL